MPGFNDIIVNVIANLISALILAVLTTLVGLGTYFIFFLRNRRRLLSFFGISDEVPDLRIYMSRMEIKPGGTTGFEPLQNGYSGPSISKLEYEAALLVRTLLRSRVAIFPKGLRSALSQRYPTMLAVEPSIEVSPKVPEYISSDNLVLLGSGIYNLATKRYLEHSMCRLALVKNDAGERVVRIHQRGFQDVEIPGRSSGCELAIIQRINDGKMVFICAGLGSSATYGAARYLVENWLMLWRKYKQSSFAICLAFPNQSPDGEMVVQPVVRFESECRELATAAGA